MSRILLPRLVGAAVLVTLSLLALLPAARAAADDYVLIIRDHRFEPATLEVPAGRAFKLTVRNMDPTPEEFESHDLDREKVIPGGSEAVIRIGPLAPGSYAFVGEFNESTAKGNMVAK